MQAPAFCIYTSLFTLADRDPANNQYVWIYFTWLWSLLLNGGLDHTCDRIVVHIDPATYTFIKRIELHNDLQVITNEMLTYYIHPAPSTLLEGFFNRHDPTFIRYLMAHPNCNNTIFLHMDIDTIFQKPLRSLPWPTLGPNIIFTMLEGVSIHSDCHLGAFLPGCRISSEINYYNSTLHEFMQSAGGFTAGMFGFTAGDGVKSAFDEIQLLKHTDANTGKYYEQGVFNYVVSKYHIIGSVTMHHDPLSLRTYVGANEDKGEAILSLMGEAGNGIFHLEKVLGYLFTRAGRYIEKKSINNMEYSVVVARYNEDISWLSAFNPSNVIIYNKGDALPACNYTQIQLPNIGREAHTYLSYIVEHYNNLPNVCFFTQGSISDHDISIKSDDLYAKYINIKTYSNTSRIGQLTDYLINYKITHYNCTLVESKYTMETFFTTHVKPNIPSPANIYWNAIFSVTKDRILSRPLSYYKSLLELPDLAHKDSEIAHFFERSWYYIFNCDCV